MTFKYDPLGRRIQKVSSAGTSVYAYDGDNLIEETDASGTAVARYAQGLNIDEPLAMLRSSATSYYNADGLGSVTSLANGSGTLTQTYTYDSFGKLTASSGSVVNPFQYTAREFDPETGLNYYRARYYDQGVGRFLSEDPISFKGGINFYAYVKNSPVTFFDPFGLRIDWAGYVLSNPLVRSNFERLDASIVQSGIPDDCFVLRVTGGDRYRDPNNPQIHRSATNNSIVVGSARTSPHLRNNGARAIDFVIQNNTDDCECRPVTDDLIDQLLPSTDFLPANTLRNYPEGPHTHIALPNLCRYYVGGTQ